MRALLLCFLLLPLLAVPARASDLEARLLDDLLSRYHRRLRPVVNASDAVSVALSLTVQEVELDVERHQAVLSLWVSLTWKDPLLRWDPEDYDGISSVRLMPKDVWMPDIMPYNMLPRPDLNWLAPTPVVVSSDGGMLYVGPSSTRVACRRNYEHNALPSFLCSLKLGSWTYDGYKLNLTEAGVDTSSYVERDPMWDLHKATAKRNSVLYACCPEPYLDVTLTVEMVQAGQLSAWPNLPVAVSLLTALAAFLVPVDSPQKLTLPCLSVLVAGSAVVTEFGLEGTAAYRAYFLRTYHVNTYIALGVLLWTVLVVVVGRPRALGLPRCLRRCLTSCLGAVCCLASAPLSDDKALCHEWTALAELLDRAMFVVFLVLIIIGSASSAWSGP